jgi:predicted DNA-binding transcriptional regulator AlpA
MQTELLDRTAACEFFGGLHPSSLYRGIRAERFPKPVKIGALSRWLRSECEAALARMIEGRAS